MAEVKLEVDKTLYIRMEDGTAGVLSEGTEAYLCFGGRWSHVTVVELRLKSMLLRSEDGVEFVKLYSKLEDVSDKKPIGVNL